MPREPGPAPSSTDPAASAAAAKRGRRRRALSVLPLALSVALGVLAGIGAYTFSYAKGLSYFSTDPRACANCHIMQREYDSWQKASHHTSAVCVDCHLPEAFVPKYLAKAENGWRHGKLFTTGGFVEPIEVKPAGISILENNCLRCHGEVTSDMRLHGTQGARSDHPGNVSCLHCHSGVGHGEKAGLGGPLRAEELESIQHLAGAPVSATP